MSSRALRGGKPCLENPVWRPSPANSPDTICWTLFRNFRYTWKKSKIVTNNSRHFSTIFARHQYSGPFCQWGALLGIKLRDFRDFCFFRSWQFALLGSVFGSISQTCFPWSDLWVLQRYCTRGAPSPPSPLRMLKKIQKRRTWYHPRGTSWWRTCEATQVVQRYRTRRFPLHEAPRMPPKIEKMKTQLAPSAKRAWYV